MRVSPPPKTSPRSVLPPGSQETLGAAQRVSLPEQLSLFRLPPAAPPPKTRHLQIGARIVSYELLGGRRRLSMSIDERGLRIGVPRGLPLTEIENFVRLHGDWVLKKLDEHVAQHAHRHLAIRDGTTIPVLDGEVRVQVVSGGNRVNWQDDRLILAARADADLDALARRGLQRRALDVFGARVDLFAARMGRPAPALGLSSARTRWGSCSQQSGVRLNWRLIHLPLHLVDYVVAHELAHLIEMNHSPRFWDEVERLFPNCRAARRELKTRTATIPLI